MSQSANRGGMGSALGGFANVTGNMMQNGNYGRNYNMNNGTWNGQALNYSNGLLNPQGNIAGLSGWGNMTAPNYGGMNNAQYSTDQAPKIGANSTVAMQPNGSMGFVDPYGTGSSQQMPVQNTQQPSTSTQSNGTVGVDPVTGRLVFK